MHKLLNTFVHMLLKMKHIKINFSLECKNNHWNKNNSLTESVARKVIDQRRLSGRHNAILTFDFSWKSKLQTARSLSRLTYHMSYSHCTNILATAAVNWRTCACNVLMFSSCGFNYFLIVFNLSRHEWCEFEENSLDRYAFYSCVKVDEYCRLGREEIDTYHIVCVCVSLLLFCSLTIILNNLFKSH